MWPTGKCRQFQFLSSRPVLNVQALGGVQLIVTYARVMIAMLGVLVISVGGVALNHVETRYAQPNNHIDAGDTHKDIQKSFKPRHTEGNPGNAVEAEDTNRKPVKRADNGKNKRDNRKNVESSFQNALPSLLVVLLV